jgi:tetratricopeptide (TPR) repeat protein
VTGRSRLALAPSALTFAFAFAVFGSLAAPSLAAAAPISKEEASRAEAEGKRAFDSGRFQEAGEKYARAAEGAPTPERRSELAFQSGWAYFIAGNSKAARESLKVAFLARPNIEVVADFYSPDFVRLAQSVRNEVAGPGVVPAFDLAELKRTAREKIADGKAEEALYDLKQAEASTDPQVHRLTAEALDKLGRGPEADAERRRATDLEKGLVQTSPIATAPPLTSSSASNAPASSAAPLVDAAEAALKNADYRGAQAMATRALDADPRSSDARRILGDTALALGQEGDAEREFTAALVLDATTGGRSSSRPRTLRRRSVSAVRWTSSRTRPRRASRTAARSRSIRRPPTRATISGFSSTGASSSTGPSRS